MTVEQTLNKTLKETEKLKLGGLIWCDINELLALAKKKEAEEKI